MTILVTGAAGFIGSNFVLDWFDQSDEDIVSLDLLTYAGNLENLSALDSNPHHHFVEGDIRDKVLISELIKKFEVRAVLHFAAESHVDRSIHGSADFIETYCDVADPTSVMQAFKFARQQGPIKGVIHSAAITEARCAVVDTPLEVWQRVIAVNLTGTFIVTKVAVPYLLETKGVGVLLSSRAGKAGTRRHSYRSPSTGSIRVLRHAG